MDRLDKATTSPCLRSLWGYNIGKLLKHFYNARDSVDKLRERWMERFQMLIIEYSFQSSHSTRHKLMPDVS